METDRRKLYGTASPVLQEARIAHDPFDAFGWVQEWRFAIVQYLTDVGEHVPGFRTTGGGAADIRDDYAYDALFAMRCSVEVDDLRYALKILDRYREWLRITGKDY